jgi:hypothetical protein
MAPQTSHSAAHDSERRFWAALLILLCSFGLATGVRPAPGFWSSYVLDMTGPAWGYILLRGLFAKDQQTHLSAFFTPEVTLVFITTACTLIEIAQYLRLYEAHHDPYDFLAYVSLLVPCYVIDRWLLARRGRRTAHRHSALDSDHA